MSDTAIIQPFIPHYREEFFDRLSDKVEYDLYELEYKRSINRHGLKSANINFNTLQTFNVKGIKIFNPFFVKGYDKVVLSGEKSILTVWLILLLKKILHIKVFIYGHGANYRKENKVGAALYFMYKMSDGGILYTEREKKFWTRKLSGKKWTYLNNTLYVDRKYYFSINNENDKSRLRNKYNINERLIFISSHRFTNKYRRHDLLVKTIERMKGEDVGFIIIGDGPLKPNFNSFDHVYDFGAVWSRRKKSELFSISNYYLQMGWVGLSIVEALAYGKPVITMKRCKEVKHSVEYSYLRNNYNSIILNQFDKVDKVLKISRERYKKLVENCYATYDNKLDINFMVKRMREFIDG